MLRHLPKLLLALAVLAQAGCVVVEPRPARVWVPGYWSPAHVWVGGYYRYR